MIRRLIFGLGAALCLLGLLPTKAQIGPIPGLGPIIQGGFGCAAPVVTGLGGNQNTAGATLAISGATVPTGSLIVVVVNDSGGTAGSVSDGTNTYSLAASQVNSTSGAIAEIFFAAGAHLSAGTITYTKGASGSPTAMGAFYASNIAQSSPQDAAVTAKTSGTGSTITVTSGTPAQSGELFVGGLGLGTLTAAPTITQDTGNGWATPFSQQTTGSSPFTAVFAGTQVNAGTGTKTYAPTWTGGSSPTPIDMIVGFKHC